MTLLKSEHMKVVKTRSMCFLRLLKARLYGHIFEYQKPAMVKEDDAV